MTAEFAAINGIDGSSGNYLLPPLSAAQVSALARGEHLDELEPEHLEELRHRNQMRQMGAHFGVVEGVDPKNLAEAGWGIIFSFDSPPEIRAALDELIEWRREQASRLKEGRFREYSGPDGYRPNESKQEFLERHGAGPGPADPDIVPYYLLIVGDPETIPYRFQYQLDVQYAVGRLHFDQPEDYALYAHSVVQAEKQGLVLPRRMAFFGVDNPDDAATNLSSAELITPLAHTFQEKNGSWEIVSHRGEPATKECLSSLLGGDNTPALLFSASHGIGFPNGDPRQIPHQGALLCQDWPGPKNWRFPIPEDFYYSGTDLASDARLMGLIAFHFACYGAGTPQHDEFSKQNFAGRSEIAPRSFVSGLAQRLLAHPKGGALAVLGHVDRAWGYSFMWGQAGRQIAVYESTLQRLVDGHPVGSALEYFNERYAELSSDLAQVLDDARFGKKVNDLKLAGMWTANNDARNFIIVGDPAVRMMVAAGEDQAAKSGQERPVLDLSSLPAPSIEPALAALSAEPLPRVEMNPAAEIVDYGLLDNLRQAQDSVSASLQQFLGSLSTFLIRALDDASSLEVATYTSENLTSKSYAEGGFKDARLRALTRIKIDGDTVVCVPEQDGEVDEELWKIHLDMLQVAQASRAELLRAVISAASGLAGSIKPGG
jgi:hypothetical protein